MNKIQSYIEAYKAHNPAQREHLRNRAAYLSQSPSRLPHEHEFNVELLRAFEEAEKQLSPVPPVQTVKFELPDITGQTVLKVGKYAAIGAAGYVGLYAIGAAAVGIAASIAAFFAAYGVWLVGVCVVIIALKCVEWRAVFVRGEGVETVVEEFEHETFYQHTKYKKTTTI